MEHALAHASAVLGHPIPQSRFEEARRPDDRDGGLAGALRAADSAGFEVAVGPLSLSELDRAVLPAVLLTRSGALVLEERQGAGWAVHDPRLGAGSRTYLADADVTAAYAGQAILLRPRAGAGGETVQRGHWFRSALAANKWSYVQVALAAAVANILGLTTSIFIMVVYDRVLPNEAMESLVALTIGVGIALGFDFAIRSLRAGFIDRAGQRADLSMGRAIFERVLSIRLAARSGSTGATAASLREFEMIRDFFTSASLVAIVDLPFILLFVGVIYLIGGPLALVPAVAIPTVLIVALVTQPFLARLAERSFADGQSKQSVLVEALSGLETIKASRGEARMKTRWDRALAAQAEHGVRSRAISQLALNATAFVQQVSQIAIVFFGVFLIVEGSLSMGALIASVILTGRALTPLAQIAQTLTRISQTRTAYRAIERMMQSETERPDGKRYLARDLVAGRVSIHKVSFSYPGASEGSLEDVSLDIAAGEKVAILGPIGSGKSTLARLMLGLYQPASGAVRVDGTDIRQIDPGDLRRNIGSVLQDAWLFSGTLRENITLGMPHAGDAEVLEAARVAGVEDFAATRADGYDLMIGERGEGLSGGQRQSVALARALLGRPPVLLLDEPTSAMDVMTEKAVIARLKEHLAGRTLIVVTHRPSLLELVDRVIVLGQGKIVADGPKDSVVGSVAGQGG
ncbi:type I secretion system permease/ATPase [Alphaproteobacteria bacterium GH1-50]|uniref:Type I secretion system permease/ATPase n=1 Tax=Kangsaoukella pontilimi TaxID=2691042 RepID=A0A7C9IG32_9RHOB|nr:type I secretion system permease/ATPase [Kangsaoukella pontilimi]